MGRKVSPAERFRKALMEAVGEARLKIAIEQLLDVPATISGLLRRGIDGAHHGLSMLNFPRGWNVGK